MRAGAKKQDPAGGWLVRKSTTQPGEGRVVALGDSLAEWLWILRQDSAAEIADG